MSQLTRPTKQGGATTYQGKVGAGYTTILASEMDDDLDKIYSAWNTGVDGSNIRPGVITGGMLAPGAVGSRELADGGVATVDLADAAVTTPKLADGAVTSGKIAPGGVPPGGAAGGDLTGSYPNPSLGVVQSGTVALGSGAWISTNGTTYEIAANKPGVPGYNSGKAGWTQVVDLGSDTWAVYRTPVGTSAFSEFMWVDSAAKLHATLADGAVGRAQIATNAIYGGQTLSQCPANYTAVSPVGSWFTYMTLNPITTRGALVMLLAQHNLSCIGPSSGNFVVQRWVRGVTPLQERASLVGGPTTATYGSMPGLVQFDTPAAGTYTYSLQLWLSTGCSVLSTNSTQGFLQAIEIG